MVEGLVSVIFPEVAPVGTLNARCFGETVNGFFAGAGAVGVAVGVGVAATDIDEVGVGVAVEVVVGVPPLLVGEAVGAGELVMVGVGVLFEVGVELAVALAVGDGPPTKDNFVTKALKKPLVALLLV